LAAQRVCVPSSSPSNFDAAAETGIASPDTIRGAVGNGLGSAFPHDSQNASPDPCGAAQCGHVVVVMVVTFRLVLQT
jgi:hypothetical protein